MATAPFAAFERQIAWRYLRARRSEGGISVMSIISVVGIALAVFALIVTLAIRTGFRQDFVTTILGATPHASLYAQIRVDDDGVMQHGLTDFDAMVDRVAAVPGVVHVAPVVKAEVMATSDSGRNIGVQVIGTRLSDLKAVPLVAEPEDARGDIDRLGEGVAIGSGVARELGLDVGDYITLVSMGVQTAFGQSIRSNAYEVTYIFQVGRYDIDRIRVFLPFEEAQLIFDREDVADELHVTVADPDAIDAMRLPLLQAAGDQALIWTWRDANGNFLQALAVEDNVMFVLLSVLVLIAAMNIVSGLIMLVKNKGRDIGILRTVGLTEGSVLRVFFLCGASLGIAGTVIGVILGCLFVVWIDQIFAVVNALSGGGVWDPSVRYLSRLPAVLRWEDVAKAAGLSLGLSFVITWFPARRAARMNPVEALRYE